MSHSFTNSSKTSLLLDSIDIVIYQTDSDMSVWTAIGAGDFTDSSKTSRSATGLIAAFLTRKVAFHGTSGTPAAGTIAVGVSVPTVSVAGGIPVTGSIDVITPSVTLSASGTGPIVGSIAAGVSVPSVAASGGVLIPVTGTIVVAVGASVAADGTVTYRGTITAGISVPSIAASGTVQVRANQAMCLMGVS